MIACENCGHDTRMHVIGSSPAYAGCMVVVEPRTEFRRRHYCPCDKAPPKREEPSR